MKLTKEATYVFKYNDKVEEVDVYVDNVETRRYKDDQPSFNASLNYKGTGNPYKKINAELVSETILENDSEEASLMYFLPDVNAYALGSQSVVVDENDEAYTNFAIQLLNKIQ